MSQLSEYVGYTPGEGVNRSGTYLWDIGTLSWVKATSAGGGVAADVNVLNFPASQPVTGPLTDAQLRASAVPVSIAAAVTVTGPLTDAQLRAAVIETRTLLWDGVDTALISAAGRLQVELPAGGGGLTDAELRATPVPVSGPLTDAQLRAVAVPVSGPLTDAQLRAVAVPVSGPLTDAQIRATPVPTDPRPATLSVTVTGGANAIATATLPAAGAGLFHYITHIFIKRVNTAALAGGAILTVTTTNLNGRAWRTGNQASITVATHEGSQLMDQEFVHPIKSAVANVATTIVGPAAGAAVSWHIVIDYFTAA
jgi:hypothetical protein